MCLNNRNQMHLDVRSGVPQGSVIGPLLFLIYVNDIESTLHHSASICLFADGCVSFKEIKSPSRKALQNNSRAAIVEGCRKWDMQLNVEKPVSFMLMNKMSPLQSLYGFNNTPLYKVDEYIYAGITVQKT